MDIFEFLSWIFVVIMFIYQWPKVKAAFLKAIGSNKKTNVENDPIIRMLDKNMDDINKEASDELRKDPKMVRLFKEAGWKLENDKKIKKIKPL